MQAYIWLNINMNAAQAKSLNALNIEGMHLNRNPRLLSYPALRPLLPLPPIKQREPETHKEEQQDELQTAITLYIMMTAEGTTRTKQQRDL